MKKRQSLGCRGIFSEYFLYNLKWVQNSFVAKAFNSQLKETGTWKKKSLAPYLLLNDLYPISTVTWFALDEKLSLNKSTSPPPTPLQEEEEEESVGQ